MNRSSRSELALVVTALAAFVAGGSATLYVVSLFAAPDALLERESRFAAMTSVPPAAVVAIPDGAPVIAEFDERPLTLSEDSLAPHYDELRGRGLLLPVAGVRSKDLRDHFDEERGDHVHHAIDILAPRNTPVRAVENGRIQRLYLSNGGGGIAIYQFDPTETYAYYYAHLERYAEGLEEGDHVTRGQVIGYVGSTGNAPPDTPHLHFAIALLDAEKRWWQGTPINPYRVLQP